MNSRHLDEPLDYLYEELPPERMAEVRDHLAECPECREEMRVVRETVKAYRQAPRPAAPSGLAARTAAKALEEAGKASDADTPAAAFLSPDRMDGEKDFTSLKEEILRESPGGWRRRLYHPGWAVAASVIFVCAVLIHLSPRGDPWRYSTQTKSRIRYDAAPMAPSPAPEAPPLPEPTPIEPEKPTVYSPPPPALRQAERMKKDLPSLPAPSFEESAATPAPDMLEAVPDASWDATELEAAAPMVRDEAPSRPDSQREASTLSPIGAAGFGRERAEAPFASPSPSSLRPPASVETFRETGPGPTGGSRAIAGKVPGDGSAVRSPAPRAQMGERPTPVIVDMMEMKEPPQVVERPTPLDANQSIVNLVSLAGMQIASGEYAEATATIEILRGYDREKADKLAEMLARAQGIAPTGSAPAEDALEETESVDKYYSPSDAETNPSPAPISPISDGEPIPSSDTTAPVPGARRPGLYERSAGLDRSGASPRRRAAGWQRPFTTDPYYRDADF